MVFGIGLGLCPSKSHTISFIPHFRFLNEKIDFYIYNLLFIMREAGKEPGREILHSAEREV